MRWYLERYPSWPFGTFRDQAQELEAQLPVWGRELYARTLAKAHAQVDPWRRAASGARRVVIKVDDVRSEGESIADAQRGAAALLGLPWELIADQEGYLFGGGLGARVVRRIPRAGAKDPLPTASPLRVLLVISRPEQEGEGRYRIEREIGEGGMATVYLADDLKHSKRRGSRGELDRLRQQARTESPRVHRRLFDLSVRGSTGAF